MQLVSGQSFQHGQHGGCFRLGLGQVHIAVVAALHLTGTGDGTLKSGHEAERVHGQGQRLGGGQARVSR